MSTEIFPINEFSGQWHGTHQFFLKPNELAGEGKFNMTITNRLNEKIIEMEYSQTIEKKDYFGIFLLSFLPGKKNETAWIDEFHTFSGVMKFSGEVNLQGLSLLGGYSAGEEYRKWTIDFSYESKELWIRHYNHPLNRDKFLGIEIHLHRHEE